MSGVALLTADMAGELLVWSRPRSCGARRDKTGLAINAALRAIARGAAIVVQNDYRDDDEHGIYCPICGADGPTPYRPLSLGFQCDQCRATWSEDWRRNRGSYPRAWLTEGTAASRGEDPGEDPIIGASSEDVGT